MARPQSDMTPRRDAVLFCGAGLVLLGLYLAFPDKVFVFDGIQFSDVIERDDGWREALFNPRHFLFNPALLLLRDALIRLGATIDGYALIQRVNAVLAVVGLGAFYPLCLRLTKDRALSGLATLGLGVSFAYWARATEGQVYMAMSASALAAALAAVALVQAPSPRRFAALAVLLPLAVLFHAANLALAPMALLALWWSRGALRPAMAAAVGALSAAAVVVPYMLHFGITDGPALAAFLAKTTELTRLGRGHIGGAIFGQIESARAMIKPALELAAGSLAVVPPGAAIACGAALCAVLAWAFLTCAGRPRTARAAWLTAAAGLGPVALDLCWRGGDFFWAVPAASGWALAAAAAAPAFSGKRRRVLLSAAGGAILLLAGWNLAEGIRPRSRIEINPGYRRALFVRDHTVRSSVVVLTGFGFPNSKAYVPYFAHRTREVLEYYFLSDSKEAGLAKFSGFVRRALSYGVPLYLLSDMVDDAAAQKRLFDATGATHEDVLRAFGSGAIYPYASQDPEFRVYLFIPKADPEPLFAALSYSLLDTAEMADAAETSAALKTVAGLMTPAQKRRAYEILKTGGYGVEQLRGGLVPYMDQERRRRAEQRFAEFARRQGTAEFHLRLGNLLQYLDRTEEVRREWGEAYRLSRDPELASRIARLRN
ncbi:MAG: hypothetical protein ACHQ49_17455 [Elusimicrobiota bacterium]